MRSLFSFGASKEISSAIAGSGNRPEMLRRQTLIDNARLIMGLSGLAMPFAMFALVTHDAVPFLLATLALASGMIALALHQRKLFDAAASTQVLSLLGLGLMLTLMDQRLVDAGLAVALLATVLAALLGGQNLRRLSWAGLAVVLVLGIAGSALGVSLPAVIELVPSAGLVFLACMGIVVHTATRIGGAYQVYDKTQVNAYRHLIEHVQDAVLRFSSDGELLLASQSSERLFGCPRYQLTSSGLGERLHVADRPTYLTAFADANQGGKARVIEVRMRQDDVRAANNVPRFIWVEISLSPVIDSDGFALRHEVVALLRDVTTRKDNDAVAAAARHAAEEASEAKSRFLATIGHELRTPLNAVVGFSEMMTNSIGGELSETHREYAGLIHQSGKHLLEVVRMLLDMSRLEAGKFELHTEQFAAADIVAPCISMVEASARERNVRIVTDIEDKLPLLTADERACRQILLNLMSNAIKFSHDGGSVSVAVKRQGQSLKLSVTDQGIGMSLDSLQRIGEPFFQAQNGLSRRYEGTGLGLSIVKGLVDLHDGTLRAHSEIGTGTTMTVLLPINGPATKSDDTAKITPIRKERAAAPIIPSWQDEKRKAQ